MSDFIDTRALMPSSDHPARPYYDRLNIEDAVQIAKERIEEWDYASDPHGYCHDRSVLLQLVIAAELWMAGK